MLLNTNRSLVALVTIVTGLAAASAPAAIIVDGGIGDWGISIGDNNAHGYAVFDPTIGLVNKMIENSDDHAPIGAFLGPAYGGQKYDAELLAVAYQNKTLYVLIATGQRPDNGLKYFGPGDIILETSDGIYGIELGGGPGGALPGSLITENATGATYQLRSNGETLAYNAANALQVAGSVWKNVNWLNSPVTHDPTQFEIQAGSTKAGTADYAYTMNSSTTQHAFIELAMDVSMFNGELIESITWRPACGNDELKVPVNIVPEPATMLLLAGGMLVLRDRRKRA